MDIITTSIHSVLSYVLPSIILLGLLIFVHELGHFAVAKYFKVRVEVFSLGFWKKIYQFKRGDTTYCLSIIPLGGYVKMYGDDPTAEVPEEEKKYSFLHKPVGQRIAIVLAGPLMNFFFAGFLFLIIAFVGEDVPRAIVGDIKPASAAYLAGFRSGDTIARIDGQEVSTWPEFQKILETRPQQDVSIKVRRENSSDSTDLNVRPELTMSKEILETKSEVGWVDGLGLTSVASLVGISNPDSSLAKKGFPVLALIDSINGEEVRFLRKLPVLLVQEIQQGGELKLDYKALDENLNFKSTKSLTFTPEEVKSWSDANEQSILERLGVEPASLFISSVQKGSPAATAGLKSGDRVIAINNTRVEDWDQVITLIKTYQPGGSPLEFQLRRRGEPINIQIVPLMTELMTPQGQSEKRFTIGVKPSLMSAFPDPVMVAAKNPIVGKAVKDTLKGTKMVALMFLRLLQNEVSPKNIGGLLAIGEVAGKSYKEGISQFIKMMAIFSINLFVINLFPIPILDGGHLLFFSIEALRGAPISMRKMEIAQQLGLILLMSLMIFAFFNDVSRFLSW